MSARREPIRPVIAISHHRDRLSTLATAFLFPRFPFGTVWFAAAAVKACEAWRHTPAELLLGAEYARRRSARLGLEPNARGGDWHRVNASAASFVGVDANIRPVLIGDPRAEYVGLPAQLGGSVVRIGAADAARSREASA